MWCAATDIIGATMDMGTPAAANGACVSDGPPSK
jgi:hypothetical protein